VIQNFKKLNDSNLPILILGTRATVRSHTYKQLIQAALGTEVNVIEQECPLLVPMIEESWIKHPILEATVSEYIKAYTQLPKGVALLACTHYPWIKGIFEKLLPGWQVFDSAVAMGEALTQHFPASTSKKAGEASETHWQFSDPDSVPAFVFSEDLGRPHA
jgi:glutamate racemase